MKFADKYELSDAITTAAGDIRGRDVASGDRVLVYIFRRTRKESRPADGAVALESFRAAAPEPPGLVIASRKIRQHKLRLLVTQFPDDAALRGNGRKL